MITDESGQSAGFEIVEDKLTGFVREAWRNACENGYGETLRAMSLETVALDMINCDAEIERCAHLMNHRGSMIEDFEGLQHRIVSVLPQIMRECIDEGCPHHGTIHECVSGTVQ